MFVFYSTELSLMRLEVEELEDKPYSELEGLEGLDNQVIPELEGNTKTKAQTDRSTWRGWTTR